MSRLKYGLEERAEYIQCKMMAEGRDFISRKDIRKILKYDCENFKEVIMQGDEFAFPGIGCVSLAIKKAMPERQKYDMTVGEFRTLPPTKPFNIPKFRFYKKYREEIKQQTYGNPVKEPEDLDG